ncbi:MAG: hypothetical protein AAGF12_16665 [Myxococcota bacterium]
MTRTTSIAPGLVLLLVLSACGDDSSSSTEEPIEPEPTAESEPESNPTAMAETSPSARAEAPSGTPTAGGIRWTAPEPFRAQQPQSRMRAAEYVFPEEEGETAATMTVFFFGAGQGGSVQANIDRWVGQFTQSDGRESAEVAQIENKEVNGLQVTTVDLTGTYTASPMMGGSGAPQDNQRMLAAIVEGPDGPVFFKMVGQGSLMERAEDPFNELVSTFETM